MTDNIDLTTLRQFKCYNVCIEMLKDRGIDTQDFDIIDIKTFLQNKDQYSIISLMNNNGKYIMVLFNKSCKKPTNDELSAIIGKNNNIGEILYFYIPSNFEYEKKQSIEEKLISDTIKITPYNMGVWCINPTKHVLQPKYILHKKNTEKYQEIIKQYEKSSLPKFCIDDPIVKYYDAMPDDIFEIRRIGQETLSYRIVSNKQINLFKNK